MIALDDGPPVQFLQARGRSAVLPRPPQVWGARNLALILTGMGTDGTARRRATIVAAGGSVIAQDEATSVVWGMPGAAAQAGVCSAVLPLDQIAPKVVAAVPGGQP